MNDSGQPLLGAGWQHSDHVRMLHTNRRERSVARNAPCALQHFWALSQSSQAKRLYGVTQFVDRMHNPTIRLPHGLNGNCFIQFMAGEWIPLQSSLIVPQTFFEINGFSPLLSGPEDIDLLRRFGLVSEVAGTPYLVAYFVRGEEGSRTDYGKHQQASRWAREKILDSPVVYRAMCSSARTLARADGSHLPYLLPVEHPGSRNRPNHPGLLAGQVLEHFWKQLSFLFLLGFLEQSFEPVWRKFFAWS